MFVFVFSVGIGGDGSVGGGGSGGGATKFCSIVFALIFYRIAPTFEGRILYVDKHIFLAQKCLIEAMKQSKLTNMRHFFTQLPVFVLYRVGSIKGCR